MLLSAVYCHAGETQKTIEINQKAQNFSEEHQLKDDLIRLEIEELILLLDSEEFAKIAYIFPNLQQLVDRDTTLLNLQMRYHGTMGQIHAYGHLANIKPFSKEKSLTHFKKALDCAYKLKQPGDIAQDQNYMHLWYALFEPETSNENEAFLEAKKWINYQIEDKELQTKNKNYLYRQKAFSLYRNYLLNGKIPEFKIEEIKMDCPDDWQDAVWNKYIAVLKAASGKKEEATAFFERAIKAINPNTSSKIKAVIRLTVLVEAYRMTHNDEYKKLATRLDLDELTPLFSKKWIEYLSNQNLKFPGLNYWY